MRAPSDSEEEISEEEELVEQKEVEGDSLESNNLLLLANDLLLPMPLAGKTNEAAEVVVTRMVLDGVAKFVGLDVLSRLFGCFGCK